MTNQLDARDINVPTSNTLDEQIDKTLINILLDMSYNIEAYGFIDSKSYLTDLKQEIANLMEQSNNRANKVDRFEVIDETGRVYVRGSIYGTPVKIELSYQDEDRTLKVFVSQLQAILNKKEGK